MGTKRTKPRKGGNGMNKIYYAVVDEDVGGCYISAKDTREAKKIAPMSELISEYMQSYIDLKCHVCKDEKGKFRQTQIPSKVLEIKEIISEKIHWWFCKNEECEQDEYFEYVNDAIYKCPKCNNAYEIPYMDY